MSYKRKPDEEKTWTVYKHVFPNSKVYIGITSMPIIYRWRNGKGYDAQLVGRAIQKYGWNNIEHIIIAQNLSEENANIAERKLIKRYRSDDLRYGYNRDPGGNARRHGEAMTEEGKDIRSNCPYSESIKVDIDCYNLDGEFIKTYHGYREANKELGFNKSNMVLCAQKKIGRVGNYILRFHKETKGKNIDPYIEPIFAQNMKPVNQYSLDGTYLHTYESVSEAARQIGAKGGSSINNCCLGKIQTSYNYIWQYDNGNHSNIMPKPKNKKAPKEVAQYDSEGNFIQKFANMMEASKVTNISYGIIRHYIDGSRKSGGGFIWKCVEECCNE